jgi:hypothetical protein
MLQRVCRKGLWISAILVIVLIIAQGWTGNWSVFYLLWPGSNVTSMFLQITAQMAVYHMRMGFAIGAISVLILIFSFLAKSNLYVRILAILGFVITVLAVIGGFLFVTSSLQDRLSLGQMADSFLGVLAADFLILFFLNKVPRFPWNRNKET